MGGSDDDQDDGAGGADGDDEDGGEIGERKSKDPNAPIHVPYKPSKKIHTINNSPAKQHARSLSENLTFYNGKKMAGYPSVAP